MSEMTKDDVREVSCTTGGDLVGLYVLGHVDMDAALPVFMEYAAENGCEEDDIRRAKMHHEWWQKVPDRGGVCDTRLLRAKQGAMGAFAVTHLEVQSWKR